MIKTIHADYFDEQIDRINQKTNRTYTDGERDILRILCSIADSLSALADIEESRRAEELKSRRKNNAT